MCIIRTEESAIKGKAVTFQARSVNCFGCRYNDCYVRDASENHPLEEWKLTTGIAPPVTADHVLQYPLMPLMQRFISAV